MTSYLRDTTDFLNNIPETVPKDTILASFDIESLYSTIPHALGLEAVDYWLEKYPETLNSRFTKEFILDGIKLILENNNFCFNDTYFKQEKGTAMGTKFAPVHGTLTIGHLQENYLIELKKIMTLTFNTFSKHTGNDFWTIASFPGLNLKKN